MSKFFVLSVLAVFLCQILETNGLYCEQMTATGTNLALAEVKTVNCTPATGEGQDEYCFAGQFWFNDHLSKLTSLLLKDCTANIGYQLEKFNKDLAKTVDIDCPTTIPARRNTTKSSYAYRCCTRTECEIPKFDETINDENVHDSSEEVDEGNSAIKNAIPTIVLILLIFCLKFFE